MAQVLKQAEQPIPQPNGPFNWKVGEHIAIVGDTGTGKTYLMSKLLRTRQYVVFLRVKPDDITFPGFTKARHAKIMDTLYAQRILLDPKYPEQMREGYHMLNRAFEQGGWTVGIDEQWYLEQQLKLRPYADRLFTQGRSKKISVVAGMQRPSQISRFVMSQCTHLFVFRIEGRDLMSVKESTTPRIVPVVSNLDGHDFAYYNRRTRSVLRGNANDLGKILYLPQNHDQ